MRGGLKSTSVFWGEMCEHCVAPSRIRGSIRQWIQCFFLWTIRRHKYSTGAQSFYGDTRFVVFCCAPRLAPRHGNPPHGAPRLLVVGGGTRAPPCRGSLCHDDRVPAGMFLFSFSPSHIFFSTTYIVYWTIYLCPKCHILFYLSRSFQHKFDTFNRFFYHS